MEHSVRFRLKTPTPIPCPTTNELRLQSKRRRGCHQRRCRTVRNSSFCGIVPPGTQRTPTSSHRACTSLCCLLAFLSREPAEPSFSISNSLDPCQSEIDSVRSFKDGGVICRGCKTFATRTNSRRRECSRSLAVEQHSWHLNNTNGIYVRKPNVETCQVTPTTP